MLMLLSIDYWEYLFPGMMGELVRREAEIAIAPLTINSQREQASWPFCLALTGTEEGQ
jgi:Ligated ion channel L-glutamate- and glycine-binding site